MANLYRIATACATCGEVFDPGTKVYKTFMKRLNEAGWQEYHDANGNIAFYCPKHRI